jgi:hypothetical protein
MRGLLLRTVERLPETRDCDCAAQPAG